MNMELKIKASLSMANKRQVDVAEAMGMSQANFNKKLKRQTFTSDELEEIAKIIGATYHSYFEFPNGNKI